jgi:drug/metabolite transporter (DMT)-like permease
MQYVNMGSRNKTALFNLSVVVSMIIWGGSWVSGKAIAEVLPAETLTFWRFLINLVSFIPILMFLKEPMKLNRSASFYILLGSVCMGLYLYLFFKGLSYGYAGVGGVMVSTMVPLATVALSIILLRQKVLRKDYIGLALGIIGGCILLEIWSLDWNKLFMSGNIYFLLCAFLWALLTICSQKAAEWVSPLVFSFFVYAFCSVLYFFLALPNSITGVFKQGSFFWLNMLYLAIISSTLATTIYFFASSRLSSYRASSFVFLVPFSAVMLSWIFLGEVPKISTITGGVTALAAVYLINMN